MADEPTGNIDPETSYRLVELLKDICDSGKTVVIATHQYDLIERFPGRVFRCENGIVREDFSFAEKQAAKNKVINDGLESEFVDVGSPAIAEPVEEPLETFEEIVSTDTETGNTIIEVTTSEIQIEEPVNEEMATIETTILVEEENLIAEELPREKEPEEEDKPEDEKSKKKDDDGPDIVGFELI